MSRNGKGSESSEDQVERLVPAVLRVDADEREENKDNEDNDDDWIEEALDNFERSNRNKLDNEEEIVQVIKEQHCGPIGGHRGINATEKAVSLYYEIPNLRERIKGFIRKCPSCQVNKYNRVHRELPLTLTTTSVEPNDKVAFDIIGPFKYPNGDKLYGLTIQDDFTKYIAFCGINNCTAETIAKAFIEKWVFNYGIPRILLSDNGSNLCGEIMTAVANYFGIKRITTSLCHPQSNGALERSHARLAEFIRSTDGELESDMEWEQKLECASYCYNTTVHTATGVTPFYLMFGRKPRLITSVGHELKLKTASNYLATFQRNLETVWLKARENIERAKVKAIERDEMKTERRKVEEFFVGQQVLIMTRTVKGKTNRTEPVWMGPFNVTEVTNNNVVIKKRNRVCTINKANCKPFVTD